MQRYGLALGISMALLAAACSGSDGSATEISTPGSTAPASAPPVTESPESPESPSTEPPPPPPETTTPPLQEIDLTVRPGIEQLAVLGADPGTAMSVSTDDLTDTVATGVVDEYGSLLFRGLDAGRVYAITTDDGISAPHEVLARNEHPDPAFYAEQRLPSPGFGYIETRDGTTLSANIVLPGPVEDGPYPTVVEYSGYSPSNPEEAGFKDLFGPLGYAYVGINMRGTGCSGGSFRYFEYAQSIDGYDVVEAVAAQPWVLDNEVGMVGVSYPGISQLFVAQTQPPSLAAITPLSVLDDSYNSTLYPGGILNTGFAVEWTQDRVDQGQPAVDPNGTILEDGGQGWAKDQITGGDETCEANQSLRLQNPDLVQEIADTPFYEPSTSDEIAPRLFVDKINVPTFVAGAWQDEQTGGRFPTMLDRFTGTDHFYASLVNGLHTESIGPGMLPRWIEFLDLYVAKRTPNLDVARAIAPILASGLYGTESIELPADRFTGMSFEDALAAFESEPPIRVLFEEGAADGTPARTPLPRFVEEFESWPIPSTQPTEWFLGPDGALADSAATTAADISYLALPDSVPHTFYEGNSSDIWKLDVQWDWLEPGVGSDANFVSAPLTEAVTMIGSGSADLWVRSNLGDTDLEVTLSEVRPDGQEMYVQSGWLRASQRKLNDGESTPLRPVHTHAEADVQPLTDGTDVSFELARVEIFPFAHVFRPGSQIRISIDAPGGNRPVWVFETIANGEQVTLGLGGGFASKIVLPVIPGIDVPAEYPECGALRGQPCREYLG